MAERLNLLRQKLEAAEAAARAADLDAGNGVPGATIRAEALHREAQFYSTRMARLEAEQPHCEPFVTDRTIHRLENSDGTIQ